MLTNMMDTHVGRRIAQRRIQLEISQEQLAERLGISREQMQKYESGLRHVSRQRLAEVGKVLEVSPEFFFMAGDTP